jgi:large subunit ribosomal protein L22
VPTEAGLTVDQLAQAVERDGLTGAKAVSAVRNWLDGRDHPRCKKTDIERLAAAVGVPGEGHRAVRQRDLAPPGQPTQGQARRGSDPRASEVDDAKTQLEFSLKRASTNILKALDAAVADAEEADADVTRLIRRGSPVDEGPHIKRFRPKDRGRAHPILKRTSHITVGRRSERGSYMGQKTHPFGLRLGITETHRSRWYAPKASVRRAAGRGPEDPRVPRSAAQPHAPERGGVGHPHRAHA